MIINHKETRMVKDKEDWHGLQTTNLKNLGENFQDAKSRDVAHLITGVWLVTESLKRRVLCDGPIKDRKFFIKILTSYLLTSLLTDRISREILQSTGQM